MPYSPYPVTGKLYDSDGSTLLSNVRVVLINATQGASSLSATTNTSGEFSFNLANLTNGYANGDQCTLRASYGLYYDEVVFSVDTSIGYLSQNLTVDTTIPTAVTYASVTDVRNYTNLQSTEFSDAAIQDMLNKATSMIEERTGRHWRTTTTTEYYDGDGKDMLWLNNSDIQKVTAVAIDDDDDGTHTSLTVTDPWAMTDDVHPYLDEGYIVLNDDASINRFTEGTKTVKITYTYGKEYPSEIIRHLCVLMVANMVHIEAERTKEIEKIIRNQTLKAGRGLA